MSEVKFKTLKVFDSLDFPQRCQNDLEALASEREAINGTYFPFWLKTGCALSSWLRAQGVADEEKILIYWNW